MKKKCIENKNHYRRKFSLFLFVMISVLSLSSKTRGIGNETTNYFDLIMQRIQERHKAVNVSTVDNTYTKWYMQDLLPDGSFANIDYTSTAQTNWNPLAHLDRMKYMVLSYTLPTSNFYQNEDLYNQIVSMLNFWYDKHPTSTNWYNQQIACPQRMGVILILMRSGAKQIPADLEAKLIQRMVDEGGRPDQSGSQGTGANKLDIATHWVYRGCLTQDEDVLSFGADQVYYPLFMTTDEGLQHDYSYHQHGSQIYIGSYGFSFVDGISSIADYMTGTPYEMSSEKLNYLSRFTREAYVATIRGQYFMYNVIGRAVGRKGGLSQSGFGTVLNRLKSMDPDNATEYDQGTARLKKEQPASYAITPKNKHFWRSDYMLHQRPEYFFDVRGASTYTAKNENGNGENLKGYFLADGATEITLDGTEYVDIFGVWDWNRIPGTTVPIVSKIPQPAEWSTSGSSKFSGSASDGTYGVTTYLYNDPLYSLNTSAKKSWFMFDDEIVCLGSAITSSTQTVNTTVNQTLLSGDVSVKRNGSATQQQANGTQNYSDLMWAHHRNIGYYFPEAANINISNTTQTGNWYDVSTTQTNEAISKDVFKLWFDHGNKPTGQSYEYILLPNKTLAEMEAYTPSDIEIIYNNSNLQAVQHKALDILSIVFYSATTFSHEGIEVTVDKPCVVMFRNVSTASVDTYISDPSRNYSDIKVTAKFPGISEAKELKCTLAKLKDPYAGRSVAYTIDETTAPVTPEAKYEVRTVLEDAWVRDGEYGDTNNGTANRLVVKKDNDNNGYNREAYLKFDISNIDTTTYGNYALRLKVSNANTSIAETSWIISHLDNSTQWSENTITWNNAPAIDYQIVSAPTVVAGLDFIVDITDAVLKEIRKGSTTFSINIRSANRGSDGKADAQFYSKECGTAEYLPELRLIEGAPVLAPEVIETIAIADAYVRDGSTLENNNYGAENTITVKKDGVGYAREGYLKFDLEALKGRRIRSVSMKLYVNNANTDISQIFWGINGTDTNWQEDKITFVNKPAETTDVLSSIQGVAAKNFVNFDITTYTKEQFNAGAKEVSFHLYGLDKASTGKHDAQFASKENGTVANHPRLVIELEPDAVIATAEPITTPSTTVAQASEFNVSGLLKNSGQIDFKGDLGFALVDSTDNIIEVIGLFGTNMSISAQSGWASPINVKCTISDTIPNGTYKIRTVSKATGANDWMFVYSETGSIDEIEVTLRNAPTETTWTPQNGSTDWSLASNWTNGVPGEITKVTIPKSSSYPVLESDSVKVDIIYFGAGAELKGQDLLVYNKVFVDYDFDKGDRSIHFRSRSLPLKEAYPGDYTFGGQPNAYFQVLQFDPVSQRAKFVTASGGNLQKLTPGSAFVISLDPDKDVDKGLALANGVLRLPFFDADANVDALVHPNHVYNNGVSTFSNPTNTASYNVTRSADAYRLADPLTVITPNFVKSDESTVAFVGNPFMTTIDFTKFYEQNSDLIKESYQIWTKNGDIEGYAGYNPLGNFGLILDPTLDNLVAPLQGILLEQNAIATGDLKFDLKAITADNTSSLRSLPQITDKINIIATNDKASVNTFIVKHNTGSSLFGSSDTRKLINKVNAVPEIYSIKKSARGSVLVGANVTNEDDIEYPIGFATTEKGQVTLTFSGMNNYSAKVLFTDKALNKTIDLTGLNSYEYTFNHTPKVNGEEIVPTEDRFSLRLASYTTSIEDEVNLNNFDLVITADKGFIHASTNYANTIRKIEVYNLSGILVYQANVNAISHLTSKSFVNGIYIVKVVTNNGIETKNVIVK